MSKKCRAYSESKLGLEPADNRKAFYAGWDAALAEQPAQQRPQNCGTGYCSCIECPYEQPAQQQEPVAWAVHYKGPIPLFTKTKSEAEAWGGNKIVPLYTTPPTVPVQETSGCQHKRYSVDVHEQTGTCYDCGAEGRMRFVVGDATSPTAPVQEK